MAKQIEHIRITPGVDGSHSVEHTFKKTPIKSSKASSGIGYDYPESEQHGFGPGDKEQHRMLTHIASTLGFKKVAAVEGAEDKAMSKGGKMGKAEDEGED